MAEVILLTGVSDKILFQRAIGAYRIASHLRQHGHTVQVIDFIDTFEEEELIQTVKRFIDDNTKILGISTTFLQKDDKGVGTTLQPRRITDTIERVIKYFKNNTTLKIIAGGANAFQYQDEGLFDAIITGYGEGAVLEYLENKSKIIWPVKNGTKIINGDIYPFDVQNFDHVWDKSDCVLKEETLPIEISRGCIFRCKFCSYPLNGKKKLDYIRDVEHLKKELIYNYEKFGVTNYYFSDDTFNDSTYKLEILHKLFTSLPFKIKFVAYIRLDLLYAHPEQISMLKEMGLATCGFGIESLKPETAKFIGKGLASKKIKEFLPKLYHDLWNEEIPIICSFILGLPYETIEEMTQTFNWFKEQKITTLYLPLTISPNSFYKSDIDNNYKQYGYVLHDDNINWTSPITTREEVYNLANRFNSEAWEDGTVNTWLLMSLLNYKTHTIDEFAKMKYPELMKLNLPQLKQNCVTEYKRLLNNV